MDKDELVRILHHAHGQLGLAIYRTIDDEWKQDSEKLRTDLDKAVKWLCVHEELGDAYSRGYADGKRYTAEHLIRVAEEVRNRANG